MFAILVMMPLLWLFKSNFLLVALLVIAFIPLLWIAGLTILEFLTKPFSEKGMKGFFTWVISLILSVVVYTGFFFILWYSFKALMH